MKKAVITNCHEASIRRDVDDPDEYEEIIATLPVGKTILVDDTMTFWSWNDNEYYKCNYGGKDGYIHVGLVAFQKEVK